MTRPKTDADMALDLARLAQLFLSYGKHGAADKLLNAALELDASSPAVTRVRAFTAYKCGRYAEAVELARQARADGAGGPDSAGPAADPTRASATSAGLAAMGLSLVEAFSLMSLGRAAEAGQRYASLDNAGTDNPAPDNPGPNNQPGDGLDSAAPATSRQPVDRPVGRPVGRMNSD